MSFLLAFFFAFLMHPSETATVSGKPAPYELGPEIALDLMSPLVSGNSVKLGYRIPYPGYIEFHLFSPSGEKIWQNSGVKEKGEHYQALRSDKMEAGATYTYEFRYKGKPYPGKFTNK